MNKDDYFQKVALFRYSLIAPLVANTFEASSVATYLRSVAAKSHKDPDGKMVRISFHTIERWYYRYKNNGLSAITPAVRKDYGSTRRLSDIAIEHIHCIKDQFPHITGKAIYTKLIEEGIINASETSLATVHRYIRNHDLKSPKAGGDSVKTFEMEFANDCWQADTTKGPIINIDGKKYHTFLISFIDDASRLLLHCQSER